MAGNLSIASDPLVITVDTTSPQAPVAPTLDPASDSGLSNSDNVTERHPAVLQRRRPTEPTATGRSCSASSPPTRSTVTSPWASSIGSGKVQDLGPLADGVYTYAAQQIDLAGNVGLIGPSVTVTIDTAGEGPATVPDLEAASDTGHLEHRQHHVGHPARSSTSPRPS